MIKAIALDDEPPALQIIEQFCSQTTYIKLQKTFTKTEEALSYINNFPVDLLFLDVNMPSISGVQFYKELPEKMGLILTTAYSEYAVEGFNLNAIDYLLKPFTFQRFLQAAEKAQAHYQRKTEQQEQQQEYLMLRVDYSLVKISFRDIVFIEGLDDYLKIHLQDKRPVVVRLTMKAMIEKLPASKFVRVHRSYIVPLSRIEAVRNKTISLAGEEIPVGSSYEEAFFKYFGK